jgi:hypothetical protein
MTTSWHGSKIAASGLHHEEAAWSCGLDRRLDGIAGKSALSLANRAFASECD